MTEGPLGGAAFNNEFGRPALKGHFRTYEESEQPQWRRAARLSQTDYAGGWDCQHSRRSRTKAEINVGAKLVVLAARQ
ncbi:hypothetical protein ACNKHN_14835 [Shigella flexneri]